MGLATAVLTTLKPIARADLSVVSNELERTYSIRKGEYTVEELRTALMDGFPVLAFTKARRPLYLVGEDRNYFVVQKPSGEYKEIPNAVMAKAYTGEAIIIDGVADGIPEQAGEFEAEKPEIFLWASEQDSWPEEFGPKKVETKAYLSRLRDSVPCPCEIPPHPMIVVFKKKSAEDEQEKNRGYLEGVTAQICDTEDPLTVILHELGHVYYKTRLTEEEKKACDDLQEKIKGMNDKPAVFVGKWAIKDGKEVFCTLYLWWMKGRLFGPGYTKIMSEQCPDGTELLEKIFGRVRDKMLAEAAWEKAEKRIDLWLQNVQNNGMALSIGGHMFKARLPINSPDALEIGVSHETLAAHKGSGRKWARITDGLMKGRIVILKNDRLDIDYMSERSRWWQLPGVGCGS